MPEPSGFSCKPAVLLNRWWKAVSAAVAERVWRRVPRTQSLWRWTVQIASLLVRAHRERVPMLRQSLPAIPGVEVHDEHIENGSLIVTIEDGDGYSVSDSILAVSLAQHVLCATLVYEYTDQGLELIGT